MELKKYCIIGLGHFGMNLAIMLSEAGAEVIAIDNHQDLIDNVSDKVTFAARMDATDEKALRSLGLEEMDAVVVAIGEGFEASILITALLQEIGVKKIYNRIISHVHERLLKLMGIEDMLVPEKEAAEQLARRLMIPGLVESFALSSKFGIFEIKAPGKFTGKKLIDLQLREKYGMNLVTISRKISKSGMLSLGQKEEMKIIGVPKPDTEIQEDDILVLFGEENKVKELLKEQGK